MEDEIQTAEADQPRPEFPEDPAERIAFFVKMQEQRNAAALEKIKGLMDANQFERLQQVRLQKIGLRALATEEISTELKINDEQKAKLTELVAESQAQRFSRAPREEREKAAEELNAKFLAVLSSEQKSAWETKLGPPLVDPNAPAAPATTATPTNAAPTTTPPETYVPPVSDGPIVASFDGSKEPEAEGEAE
jgi:hypothetical protein